jgi:hypothetical protein
MSTPGCLPDTPTIYYGSLKSLRSTLLAIGTVFAQIQDIEVRNVSTTLRHQLRGV